MNLPHRFHSFCRFQGFLKFFPQLSFPKRKYPDRRNLNRYIDDSTIFSEGTVDLSNDCRTRNDVGALGASRIDSRKKEFNWPTLTRNDLFPVKGTERKEKRTTCKMAGREDDERQRETKLLDPTDTSTINSEKCVYYIDYMYLSKRIVTCVCNSAWCCAFLWPAAGPRENEF